MNFNYLKIAWRILLKNKINTVINILGLGLGFSISILMMIYVYHQLSFDKFHENSDRIYRFVIEGSMTDGKVVSGALTHGEVGRQTAGEVPEIELFSRYYSQGVNELIVDNERYTADRIAWVDSAFFKMFSFPLLQGNPESVLSEPNTVVFSEAMAEKYFGDENPIGKVVKIDNQDYRITALMENVPVNSHLQFDMLAAFHTLETEERNITKQQGISFPTYVMKRKGSDEEVFMSKTIQSADAYTFSIFNEFGISISHSLQPLHRVYLFSDFSFAGSGKRGDIRNVYIFSFLALIVILIAVFNFVNLVTAQSEKRAREIGMRKVLGAYRKDLIVQFIGESLIVAFFAFLFSLLLNELLIGFFSSLIEENLRLEYWYNPVMFLLIVGFVTIVGIVAGFYPAFYLSNFQPVKVLKGSIVKTGGSHNLRKILVVFQFAISVFLVVSVLLLNRQVKYMKSKELGFDRENVVTVQQLSPSIKKTYSSLKAELLQHPSVLSVTASQNVPGENRSLQNSYKKGDDPRSAIMMYENRVQFGYLETYGMKLEEGRDFNPDMRTDTASFILNRTAVNKLGLENPIGQQILVWNQPGTVIGVVSDYNFMSLHNEIDPLALTIYSKWFQRVSIRIAPGSTSEALSYIKEVFESADPSYVFDYRFIDDVYAEMYRKEERVNALISSAALLAIIISFMGLYALTSFTIRKKIKEIGIRKTLGASVPNIIALLLRDLSRWIIAGNIIAWPIAFYVVLRWKQNFAFQIEITDYWYLFVLSGLLAAVVGISATLVQAVSAANANPVNSLKSD